MDSSRHIPEEEALLQHDSLPSSLTSSGYGATATKSLLKPSLEAGSVSQDDNLEDTTVGRNLGWSSAVIMIFSRMIGSGVFATPGTILVTAGSPGMSLILWIVSMTQR